MVSLDCVPASRWIKFNGNTWSLGSATPLRLLVRICGLLANTATSDAIIGFSLHVRVKVRNHSIQHAVLPERHTCWASCCDVCRQGNQGGCGRINKCATSPVPMVSEGADFRSSPSGHDPRRQPSELLCPSKYPPARTINFTTIHTMIDHWRKQNFALKSEDMLEMRPAH